MARTTYTAEVRDAILAATRQARSAGKSWEDALPAAQAAGYEGSAQSLYQLMLRADRETECTDAVGRALPPTIDKEGPVIVAAEATAPYGVGLEYKAISLPTQDSPDHALTRLAGEGWELVAATPVSTALLQDGAQVTRIQYVFRRSRRA